MLNKVKASLPEGYRICEKSVQKSDKRIFALVKNLENKKLLYLLGNQPIDFQAGKKVNEGFFYPLIPKNAFALAKIFTYLQPTIIGVDKPSFGFGDRLGLATPGHVQAVRDRKLRPVFAQQSIREMGRTNRTPEEVMATTIWGVFEEGYKDGFAADADHLKTLEDVEKTVPAGFTMFTCDPSDYVNDRASTMPVDELKREFNTLENHRKLLQRYVGQRFEISPELVLEFSQENLMRAAVKYYRAIKHAETMFQGIKMQVKGNFDYELSIDETENPTTPKEHLFIARELKLAGVRLTGLAPRFVGEFQKGIDYIGDLTEFSEQLKAHRTITQAFGPYKISVHSGSDKFSIYPLLKKYLGGLYHVKTAGTSYLEALRVVASFNPELFRRICHFALTRFSHDRKTYYMTTNLSAIPDVDTLANERLPELLEQNDARQVLHVTYGSVLTSKIEQEEYLFKDELMETLQKNENQYYKVLVRHFAKHLDLLEPVSEKR